MPDNILPDEITRLMKSPEIQEILSSIGGESPQRSTPQTENFTLPPDFSKKLPAIMAALSAMGLGLDSGKDISENALSPAGGENTITRTNQSPAGAQRKALLRALRPYLNGKRQSVVDSLIALDGLGGLFSAIPGGKKGGE